MIPRQKAGMNGDEWYRHSGRDVIEDFQVTKGFFIQENPMGFSSGSVFYVEYIGAVDSFLKQPFLRGCLG